MGQVYRATDTTRDRQVAIKVLPDAFASDPDRIARFEREARTLAALNHPNIAAIHGFEKSAGAYALVMELVEGEDLAQKIDGLRAQGSRLTIDEVLPIARQIADALEAAHEQGIIHRDLKPANIKVRPDGTVKVLDFGLAKALGPEAGGSGGLSMSPTITTPAMMTGVGVILGTAAYMAPEQAKGRTVDKRSDVWAFGCVFFEMLTGRRAFEGEDMTDTIAAVVRGEPDWSALPADVPASIVTLIKRCLEKDRKARVSDIGVARFLMTESLAPAASSVAPAPFARSAPLPLWRRAVPIAAAAVIAGVVVAVAAWTLRPQTPVPPVVRFTLALGEGQQFTNVNAQSLGISPDGTRIAYIANRQVYVRSLPDLDARPVAGTQPAGGGTSSVPVFSPDGQSIVFYSPAEQAIKRIAVTGGAAVTVCPAETAPLGLIWDGGDLVFAAGRQGVLRVSANGGQPSVIAAVKTGEIAASPQVLPGGEWVLFSVATSQTTEGWDKAQVVVQSLKTSERKTLVSGGSQGRYVPSGHIVYALGGVLFAVPFDPRRLTETGGPVSVVEGIRRSSTGNSGAAYYALSASGSLVFIPGPVTPASGSFDLALIDRATGAQQLLKLPPARYEHPRLSPDGKWIAVASDDGKDAIVWIHDASGVASIRRLTLSGRNRYPVWSPDGEYVTFQSDREGDLAIWRQRADGTAPAERLTKPDKDTAHLPESWSPDGRTLLFSVGKGVSFTAAALSMPDRKVTPFGGMQSSILFSLAFSPDGKWVAYEAKDATTTQNPLFVQPFPPTGATYQISTNGVHATWSPDGKELFYGPTSGQLIAVSVATRPAFSFGNPVTLSLPHIDSGPPIERNNDITRDGKKFLIVIGGGTDTPGAAPRIQVVLNWAEELKQRVPSK